MKVRFTKRALIQLDDALLFIDAQNPRGARRVKHRFQDLIELLALYPKTGQEIDRPGLRRMVANPYPYVIFYRVTNDEVIIQRIRHAARRPL